MSISEKKSESVTVGVISEPDTQTSTILLGKHLIIHVMSSSSAKKSIRRWKLPPNIASLMSEIWPVKNPRVSWPPGNALNDTDIGLLADQFYNRVIALSRQYF